MPLVINEFVRVTFYSPGTMFPEETTRDIESEDPLEAVCMASTIVERHNAVPHSFRFTVWEKPEPIEDREFEAKKLRSSGMYFIDGKVETLEEVEARHDPSEKILLSNMRNNDFSKIVVCCDHWKSTYPFRPEDGDQIIRSEHAKGERDTKTDST